ncbi:CARDB domain-containing protein [Halovivax limisalsi]|uniref:CARDB domain-containing protein n=1 Tax=Halovivax limisalsi TaxID=1453760 RepID=UPI001FFCC587|nr:CARDB domain-containing protein [Halovivax limisalsi]
MRLDAKRVSLAVCIAMVLVGAGGVVGAVGGAVAGPTQAGAGPPAGSALAVSDSGLEPVGASDYARLEPTGSIAVAANESSDGTVGSAADYIEWTEQPPGTVAEGESFYVTLTGEASQSGQVCVEQVGGAGFVSCQDHSGGVFSKIFEGIDVRTDLGLQAGESTELIGTAPGLETDAATVSVVAQPTGSLSVDVTRGGTAVSDITKLNIYDADTDELLAEKSISDPLGFEPPRTISGLPTDADYEVEAFVRDTYVGTTGSVSIQADETTAAEIQAPETVSVDVAVNMSDGETPLEGATVQLLSDEGRIWHEDVTGAQGTTETFDVQPPAEVRQGDYLLAAVIYEGEWVGSTRLAERTAGTKTIVTDVDPSSVFGFSYEPDSPGAGNSVTFTGTAGTDHYWEFGDGESATGQYVSHTYAEAGAYAVSLTVDGETYEREVTVEPSEGGIDSIDRERGGVPLASINYPETFTVTLEDGTPTPDRVRFELGGREKTVDGSADAYEAAFDLGELDGSTHLSVTVEDDDGQNYVAREYVKIQSVPEWMDWMVDGKLGTTVGVDEGTITLEYGPFNLNAYEFSIGDVPLTVDPPNFDGGPTVGISYDSYTRRATAYGSGGFSTDLLGYGFSIDVSADATFEDKLEFVEATATADTSLSAQVGPPLQIDPPLVDPLGVETTLTPSLGLQGEFNETFAFQEGTVSPGADLTVGVQTPVPAGSVGVSATGGLEGSFDVPTDPPNLSGELSVEGSGWAKSGGKEADFEVGPFTHELGSDGAATSDVVATSEPDWHLPDRRGPAPLSGVASVDGGESAVGATAALASTDRPTGPFQRLTNRTMADAQPAIASGNGTVAVAWSRQAADKPVADGRDIAVRTRDGGAWSNVTWVSDDARHDQRPVVAATDDGRLLAAWTRIDASLDSFVKPSEVYPSWEIAYSVYDGETWSDPAVLQNSSRRDRSPTVAPTGDGWALAWAQDALVENETGGTYAVAGTDVAVARIDADGTATRLDPIENASRPAVGAMPGTTGASLAYVATDAGESTVVRERVANATTQLGSYSAGTVSDLVTAGDRVVWVEGKVSEPRVVEGRNGENRTLSLDGDPTSVSELSLSTDGANAVLSYRARLAGTEANDLVYRLDRGDGWIRDHQFADAPAQNLTIWYPDTALTANGSFVSAFAAQNASMTAKNDVFVYDHDPRPRYAVAADGPANATAGDAVSIDFEVANVGDVDGTEPVTVTIADRDGPLNETTLDTIATGDTAAGTLTVAVPDSGTVDLSVESNATALSGVEHRDRILAATANRTIASAGSEPTDASLRSAASTRTETSIRLARPALSISNVSVSDPANETVAVEVENNGSAVATDVPVAITDDGDAVANGTIATVGVGETVTWIASVDPAALNRTAPATVSIRTGETVSSESVTNATRTTWLYQPALTVHDDIRVLNRTDGIAVRGLVSNGGPIDANATVSLATVGQNGSTSTALASERLAFEAGAANTTFRTARFLLDSDAIEANETVRLLAESTVPDADPSTTATRRTIEALTPAPPTVELAIADVTAEPVAGDAVELDVAAENVGMNSTNASVSLLVDGERIDRAAGTLKSGENATRTLTWMPDAAGDYRLAVRSDDDRAATTVSVSSDDGGGGGPALPPAPSPEPDVSIVDVQPSATSLAVGESLSVTVTVTNDGDAAGEIEVPLSIDGAVVTTETVSVEAGATATVTLSAPIESSGTHAIAVDGESVGTVEVTEQDNPDDGEDGTDGGSDDGTDGQDGTDAQDGEDGSGDDPTDADGSAGDGVPGFGALVAVVALTLAVARARIG